MIHVIQPGIGQAAQIITLAETGVEQDKQAVILHRFFIIAAVEGRSGTFQQITSDYNRDHVALLLGWLDLILGESWHDTCDQPDNHYHNGNFANSTWPFFLSVLMPNTIAYLVWFNSIV